MTSSAPDVCPRCRKRHKRCPVCKNKTGCDEDGKETCSTCLSADAEFDRMDAEHWESSVARQSEIDYGDRDNDDD